MHITKEKSASLPDSPGVYFFKKGSHVLYIGKATSLKDRVRSYFVSDIAEVRSPLIAQMVEEATDVTFEKTDSVLEALLRESALIKKHQPKYNTKEKDNKSFYYVVVTREDFPRVLLVRGRELLLNWDEEDMRYTFGPFPHGGQLKEALKIIRKIFPFRGKSDPTYKNKKRMSRLNEELGLTPAFGTGTVTKQEYAKTIRNLKLFFEGKKKQLIKNLEKELHTAITKEHFEQAESIKRQLFALQHINDIALIKDDASEADSGQAFCIEAYDVAHIAGTERVGVMTVVQDGQTIKESYRKFIIKRDESKGDTGALEEMLERRLAHPEWSLPQCMVVDGAVAQKRVAERILREHTLHIPVVAVTKDEHHRPKKLLGSQEIIKKYENDIIYANAEAHRFAITYHRTRRNKRMLT